jgi:hypothetical protein
MGELGQARAALRNLLALYDLDRAGPDAGLRALRERVLRQIDALRSLHRSRAGRLGAAEEVEERTRELLLDVLHGEPDDDAVFRVVEGLRARTLLDQRTLEERGFPSPDLARRAEEAEREALRFQPTAAAEPGRLRDFELGSRLPLARPDLLEAVEELYRSADAGLVGARETAGLPEVMAALRDDELLVEYCLPADSMHPPRELWALVATREHSGRILLGELPAPGSTDVRIAVDGRAPIDFFGLNDSVALLRRGIGEDDGETPGRLEWAHDLLVKPLLDAGIDPERFPRWIVVPDGVLHAVPFAALRGPDGRFLGERVALSIVPSASVWLDLQRDPPPPQSFLGLADPRVEGLPELPDARREIVQVCRLLRNRGVACEAAMGADATESWLKERAGGRGIVHVAAHGEFPPAEAVDLHELRLAPTPGDDGRVHAYELRLLDLHAAALAVLSVCDSGTYRFGPGDELHGMVAALLLAGARDVVATLWPIDDAFGSRFVARFYGYLLQHGAAEALRRTRADLVRQGAAVRDWAAFVVVGPGRAAPGMPPS